jgi:antitoxin (DNA-binding transcriptional repressor) of toxin-antitoxin stability system
MSAESIGLADAKAHLSELADRAARGETVIITKHGKPVAQLVRSGVARKPVSLDRLRKLTDSMPMQSQGAGEFMREQRDASRY